MKLKGVDVDWAEEFNGAITVCDVDGIIVYMNKYSIRQFKKYGGIKLMGSNLIDCHPEPAKTKLIEMLEEQSENIYTTEKDGVKRMIIQTPWKENGIFRGLVEISFQFDSKIA